MRRSIWSILCAMGAALLLRPAPVSATLITFDDLAPTVVSQVASPYGGYSAVRPGYYHGDTKLVISVSGITVTISRENGAKFDLVDNTLSSQRGKDASFGTRSLDPFADTSLNGFIISFSDPVRAFSLLSGDFGGDPDGLILRAYYGENLSGGFVPGSQFAATVPGLDPHGPDPYAWTQERFYTAVPDSSAGFKSVLFYGGTANLSVFIDRLWFTRDPDEVQALVENPDQFYSEYEDLGLDNPATLGDDASVIPEPVSAMLIIGGAAVLMIRRNRAGL